MKSIPAGVWSACPTPFTDKMEIDKESVARMTEHHVRIGVKGLFLAGTCGEGAYMTEKQKKMLLGSVAKYSRGRLKVSFQVTDNSSDRILDNIKFAKDFGADIAVIAPPAVMFYQSEENILNLYLKAIRKSSLPVGIYDRGYSGAVVVSDDNLRKIYGEKNVVLVKDSSASKERMKIAIEARRQRPSLMLLNGWEFCCVDYLKAGYDGLLLGGGVFNGYMAGKIISAVKSGDMPEAEKLQKKMNAIMYAVYGGKKIKCWLSGEKKLLVEMGIFRTHRSYMNYPLTRSCVRAISRVVRENRELLFPYRQ